MTDKVSADTIEIDEIRTIRKKENKITNKG